MLRLAVRAGRSPEADEDGQMCWTNEFQASGFEMIETEPQLEKRLVTASENPDLGWNRDAPRLSSRGLTSMLVVMCLVPVVTLTVLQLTMPPVRPGYLRAEIGFRNVPPSSYYQLPLDQRLDFPEAEILVTNTMDVPWTNLNIRINNGNYQIYDHQVPIEPGQQRAFLLNRFVHRSGAIFQVGIVRPVNVEIYAALPDRSRATLDYRIE
jgi:hypothetical protein